jgi:hypothetical protein
LERRSAIVVGRAHDAPPARNLRSGFHRNGRSDLSE